MSTDMSSRARFMRRFAQYWQRRLHRLVSSRFAVRGMASPTTGAAEPVIGVLGGEMS
jgi:hypothetical protein